MEPEVTLFIEKHADQVDENGHRMVVRVNAGVIYPLLPE